MPLRARTFIGIVCVALPFTNSHAQGAQPAAGTRSARVAPWQGAAVTLLHGKAARCPADSTDSSTPYVPESTTVARPGARGDRSRIRASTFAGKSASIAAVAVEDYSLRLTLQIEGVPDRIVTTDENVLAFQAELTQANALVGKSLWTRGAQSLARAEQLCAKGFGRSEDRIQLKNLERLSVLGAEPGSMGHPVLLRVRTAGGEEGFVDGYQGHLRLALEFDSTPDSTRTFATWFHRENPRLKHPTWKPTTWQLIENGAVAIGMTRAMAELACGRSMRTAGFVMTVGTQDVATMYECNTQRFLIDKDVVTKYVDR